MLADKDRIFTNLYGQHDAGLAGARARGDWDGTAAIIARGRGLDYRGNEGLGPSRARWRRVPDGDEVVLHAQAGQSGWAAELPDHQRR